MSLVLSGNPANITSLTATVNALANNGSGAIRVTTAAPHLFATNDYVLMNAAPALGFFFITVIDATHFDLVGSTYTTTGTGTAQDLSLTPQIQVPTDGDTGSLQLSGMLSTLQALCDRTQFLRQLLTAKSIQVQQFTNSITNVAIPPGTTWMLITGCGSGGAGGGGMGGWSGTSNGSIGGGGGSGARRGVFLQQISGATALDITVGAAPLGGLGGNAGATPTAGSQGANGNFTSVAFHGSSAFASFLGGSGGGGGGASLIGDPGNPGFYVEGGKGPAGSRRGQIRTAYLKPYNLGNIFNAAGTLSIATGAWSTTEMIDPIGPMDPGQGGAAVAYDSDHVNFVSYQGQASAEGFIGGGSAAYGTTSGSYPGGGGGGGGGGGPYGIGGAGGQGGNSNNAGAATAGTAGGTATGDTGAGGGGGGSGGNGTTGGAGGNGGNGGSGFLQIMFFGTSTP